MFTIMFILTFTFACIPNFKFVFAFILTGSGARRPDTSRGVRGGRGGRGGGEHGGWKGAGAWSKEGYVQDSIVAAAGIHWYQVSIFNTLHRARNSFLGPGSISLAVHGVFYTNSVK